MIIVIYGPRRRPRIYRQLQDELHNKLTRRTMDSRGFDRKDVRIFFPALAFSPETVEVAIYAGSGVGTTMREIEAWKQWIESAVAKHYPRNVINGFLVTLEPTSQFSSIRAYDKRLAS